MTTGNRTGLSPGKEASNTEPKTPTPPGGPERRKAGTTEGEATSISSTPRRASEGKGKTPVADLSTWASTQVPAWFHARDMNGERKNLGTNCVFIDASGITDTAGELICRARVFAFMTATLEGTDLSELIGVNGTIKNGDTTRLFYAVKESRDIVTGQRVAALFREGTQINLESCQGDIFKWIQKKRANQTEFKAMLLNLWMK